MSIGSRNIAARRRNVSIGSRNIAARRREARSAGDIEAVGDGDAARRRSRVALWRMWRYGARRCGARWNVRLW
jgi:hypothetical protein